MPYTKEQARAGIEQLVATFRANEKIFLKNQAEAQVENDFVRPMFRYLNWNTENSGLSPANYEFVIQRTDRMHKRPDYVLQLDGNYLLVMDAKRARLDMHSPHLLNQVYAYAYSTQSSSPRRKIDFAILTDFQEFVVLDCSLRVGDPKALATLRVLDWRYEDYLTRFDTLWELFERENVRAAAPTRYSDQPAGLWAQRLQPRKVKANRTPPDKAFLADMDDENTGWRVRLAKDMKKRNQQADGALITAAVQLWIDRLIFVKALSDREIEDDYLARLAEIVEKDGLKESDTGWFAACQSIFESLNRTYNGSIFEPRPELEAVSVSNKVVRDILRELQPENSPYNFSVMPVEILGTIYERFLGRVVSTTDKRVKIEEKPEVRKAGGVYYTPQYIVEYIVQHTLGEKLAVCKTPEEVAKLKVLDPACGSGSFLLGAYAALIDWHIAYYSDKTRLTHKDRASAYYDDDGRVRLTARLKRQILLNNLYGVDIDPQAVEVTRFSLSLKALEDTRREELYEEVTLFHSTVLPDLRANIRCGNSLVASDYFSAQLFPDPAELRRVNPFDWERCFAPVMAAGGFDAVIGNPPYVRQEGLSEFKAYFEGHYQTYQGTADLYTYFIEKGLSLLRPGGVFGYIVANKWMRANYGLNLRRFLKAQQIMQMIDFGDLPVFESATTYPCILLIEKAAPARPAQVTQVETLDFASLDEYIQANSYPLQIEQLDDAGWSLADPAVQAVLRKIQAAGRPLGEYVSGKIYRGILTGLNEAFVIDAETRARLIAKDPRSAELIKPFLVGRDIKRYEPPRENQFLILVPRGWTRMNAKSSRDLWGWMKKNYPAIAAHLEPFSEAATKRYDKGEYWWELRACDYYPEFEKPKIIYPNITSKPNYIYDSEYYYTNQKCFIIPDYSPYLLGILNSQLSFFLYQMRLPKLRGDFYEPGYVFMKDFPIRTIDFSNAADAARHARMVALVEGMLELHQRKAQATTQAEGDLLQRQIEATDAQIDALVYELYALSAEEIRLVEAA